MHELKKDEVYHEECLCPCLVQGVDIGSTPGEQSHLRATKKSSYYQRSPPTLSETSTYLSFIDPIYKESSM